MKKVLVDAGDVLKAAQLLVGVDPSVYQDKVDGDRARRLRGYRRDAADS